jgi:hypothetical protein
LEGGSFCRGWHWRMNSRAALTVRSRITLGGGGRGKEFRRGGLITNTDIVLIVSTAIIIIIILIITTTLPHTHLEMLTSYAAPAWR